MALETEKSFPCDAEETETGYDKEYVADDFARYFRAFISSGIFMKEDTNLQVIANGDMTVTLKAGKMIIDGYRYDSTGDIIITIDPADGVLGRIDRISATWCKDEGDIHYTLQKGTPSYKPVAPECRRTEEYKDYVVADIYVAAGVIKIQQQNITDQRLNSDVCGLAIPFTELNTNAIFTQYQDAVNEFLKFADTCIDSTVVGQIESDLANKLDKTGDSGDNVVAFTQTASRQNIMTGDTHKTIFGKIKKWLADLTATAFAQMITTKEDLLATKATGYVPDAKAVADAYTELNGKLPEYIDITAKCPASTWCNIPLPDAILSTNRVIDVNRPADSDSNVYGVIWWPSADKQITILRINTNGTNLTIDNTAKTIKLRIWFC
jgi:hypothetical protein